MNSFLILNLFPLSFGTQYALKYNKNKESICYDPLMQKRGNNLLTWWSKARGEARGQATLPMHIVICRKMYYAYWFNSLKEENSCLLKAIPIGLSSWNPGGINLHTILISLCVLIMLHCFLLLACGSLALVEFKSLILSNYTYGLSYLTHDPLNFMGIFFHIYYTFCKVIFKYSGTSSTNNEYDSCVFFSL